MSTEQEVTVNFKDLDLIEPLQRALNDVGYEVPTPIQALMIPVVLSGQDVLGQAQTGTGKTAAFALPLLSKLDLEKPEPQILVLTPTRELAIQVSEAFQKYGAHLPGLKVLAVYGGQEYGLQLRPLRHGVHIVVGTPGRVMDHIERKTLKLEALTCLVLDEADEMLRMGFKEDVEWVLDHTPAKRQIALFSATLSSVIRAIAKKYLKDPQEITIRNKTATVELTRQRYWIVNRLNKMDALSRILEAESFEGVIVFVRTKSATLEVAEQLAARGFAVAALNGDIPQNQRERTIDQLKSGRLNILIATDVAARGLDVDRISHVINYDIPYDAEAYVHRIGRTGRAGRNGEAILFVAPREKRMLQTIERTTRQKIEVMEVPTIEEVNAVRISHFKQKITAALAHEEWKSFREVVETYIQEQSADPIDVAAALASMFHGDRPLLLPKLPPKPAFSAHSDESMRDTMEARRPRRTRDDSAREDSRPRRTRDDSAQEAPRPRLTRDDSTKDETTRPRHTRDDGTQKERRPRHTRDDGAQEEGMVRYRIQVGRFHGVKPGQIMGAIAGETGIEGKSIGRIQLFQEYSMVDLPDTMTEAMLRKLKRVRVVGRNLQIERCDAVQDEEQSDSPSRRPRSTEDRPLERKDSRSKRFTPRRLRNS
ncbi:MAG: DEAD/DEAH box helicase [Candidatus Riflebacteria bacterium]|nr:DEAD/DEAH box helicase [Candidatus Riflebacteria bacterium]